ncbi:MAG TPA: hypothetical protein VFL91_18430 [Thermomicrobiales bacterium]|nr:hypothetical protein [Thermomicrobiales bacterium]
MYATVRQYTHLEPETYDELLGRQGEIEALLRGVPSFYAYYMLRTPEGLTTVTICTAEAGTAESNRRVARWVAEELSSFLPRPPDIAAGEVIMHFAAP